jgi:hypothetical protein
VQRPSSSLDVVGPLRAALKLVLELLFSRLRAVDGAAHWSDALRSAAATFVVVPFCAVGLLAAVISLADMLLDVAASKSKPAFGTRARLHRFVSLAHSSAAARLFGVVGVVAVPLLLGAVGAGSLYVVLVWRQCPLACALPTSAPCAHEHASACDWAAKGLLASVLVAVQLVLGYAAARREQLARNVSGAPPADEALFAALDSDFSGALGAAELVKLLGISDGEAQALVREFDTDRSGLLDVDEFRELAAAKAHVMPKIGGADHGLFLSVITSPTLWTVFVRTVVAAFGVSLLVPVLLTAAIGGSAEHVVTSMLGVAIMATLLHAVLWCGALTVDQVVDLVVGSRAALAAHVVLVLATPAALAAAAPALAAPFPIALFCFCAVNISGLVVRENQRSLGARSGSNALVVFQLVAASLFACLVGVFMVSFVQSAVGLRKDLPDAFVVVDHGNSSLGVHTVLGGVDAARGIMKVRAAAAAGETDARFPLCSTRVQGVSLQEAALLAQAAYFGTDDQRLFLGKLFPALEPVAVPAPRPHETVVFRHFRESAGANPLNVISIRGTHVFDTMDWLQDVDIWVENVLFAVSGVGMPSLALWPITLMSRTIHFIDTHVATSLGERRRRYFEPVVDYVGTVLAKDPGARFLVVGHSLGGGLASIVGAKVHVPAVALSGPGIVGARHKIGVSLDEINLYTTSIVPSHDIVAALGVLGGGIHHVECGAHRPDVCHQPMFTVCELSRLCGALSGAMIDECSFTFDVQLRGGAQTADANDREL